MTFDGKLVATNFLITKASIVQREIGNEHTSAQAWKVASINIEYGVNRRKYVE